jgi:hypothetical protein
MCPQLRQRRLVLSITNLSLEGRVFIHSLPSRYVRQYGYQYPALLLRPFGGVRY